MSEMPRPKMTVDEFLAWAEEQPGRHELADGLVYAMSPERLGHADAKYAVQTALKQAIGQARMPCHVVPDGVTVRIDDTTAYEPDAQLYCGPRLSPLALEIPAPLIVVEVLSPSTGRYDRHHKLTGYFAVASIHHYLIVNLDRRVVIHHARDGDEIRTRILGSGLLRLNPPGLDLAVEDLLAPEEAP